MKTGLGAENVLRYNCVETAVWPTHGSMGICDGTCGHVGLFFFVEKRHLAHPYFCVEGKQFVHLTTNHWCSKQVPKLGFWLRVQKTQAAENRMPPSFARAQRRPEDKTHSQQKDFPLCFLSLFIDPLAFCTCGVL